MAGVTNHLTELRRKRGVSAIELASAAGISRQTIHAMEAGAFVPNTTVALRLAQALNCAVEELFALEDGAAAPEAHFEQAKPLPDSETAHSGQAIQLCRVGKQLIASPPSPLSWLLPTADAVVAASTFTRPGKLRVQVLQEKNFEDRLLVAGCDPGISVLARYVQTAGSDLVLAHRNSSQALALLKDGCVHVAGTHLRDPATGESNLSLISRLFPRNTVAVITFAVWEVGIVTAKENPKHIRGIDDLARQDILIVNREPGSGSRTLLDARLLQAGIAKEQVRGYGHCASGHLAAAWQVRAGLCDCCIATRAAAHLFGLHFLPLTTERYDLVIRKQHLSTPRVQQLLDLLNRSSFRRELEGLGGYDMSVSGRRVI